MTLIYSDLKATLSSVTNKKYHFTMAQPSLPTSDTIAYPTDCPMKKATASIPTTETTMSHKIIIPHPRTFFMHKKPTMSSNLVSEHGTDMTIVPQPSMPDPDASIEAMKQTKLCDLIKTEELFPRHGVSGDELYELEPHRHAMSVRRRSTQFYTLVEEEEDRDGKVVFTSSTETEVVSQDKETDRRLPVNKHVFNMAESIRRLYYPGDTWKQAGPKHTARLASDPREVEEDGLKNVELDTVDSGSETKPLLRRIQSHPELHTYSGWQTDFDVESSGEDPFTPEPKVSENEVSDFTYPTKFNKPLPIISPKTLRKVRAGESLMSRVAGALHSTRKYSKKDRNQLLQQSQQKVVTSEEQQVSIQSRRDLVSHKDPELVLHQEKVNLEVTCLKELPRNKKSNWSDGNSTDEEEPRRNKKKSPVAGLINWGTKSKVKVTNKEHNAFSPTSF